MRTKWAQQIWRSFKEPKPVWERRSSVNKLWVTPWEAETEVEKVLSFLRRFGQHHAGQMERDWDTALVRHIYDVHCITSQQPALADQAIAVFSQLVDGDRRELGRQHPDFLADPAGVLTRALGLIGSHANTRREYEQNLLPLIYGNFRPSFDESFASFNELATEMLRSLR